MTIFVERLASIQIDQPVPAKTGVYNLLMSLCHIQIYIQIYI